jgi:peptide/nickel transport system permease protein
MTAYVIRRLALIVPTIFLVTVIVFLTIRLIPGDAVRQMLMGQGGSKAAGTDFEVTVETLRRQLGLDVPIHIQYVRWVGNAFKGDLGKSIWTGAPVTELITHRFPVSLELGLLGMVTALLIAFPIGIYSAVRQDTAGDYLARSFAILCIAVPSFWLATLVVVYPSIWWGWTPPVEYIPFVEDPAANLKQFIIPALILGMLTSGTTMRMTRTMMLEVLRQDYVRTAWAKGLSERIVVMRHALKNALIPVVTIVGMNVPVIVGGSVILEQIFTLPGLGRLMLDAIGNRDYTIISGLNLFVASVVLVANMAVDLAYGYLDPRVKYD